MKKKCVDCINRRLPAMVPRTRVAYNMHTWLPMLPNESAAPDDLATRHVMLGFVRHNIGETITYTPMLGTIPANNPEAWSQSMPYQKTLILKPGGGEGTYSISIEETTTRKGGIPGTLAFAYDDTKGALVMQEKTAAAATPIELVQRTSVWDDYDCYELRVPGKGAVIVPPGHMGVPPSMPGSFKGTRALAVSNDTNQPRLTLHILKQQGNSCSEAGSADARAGISCPVSDMCRLQCKCRLGYSGPLCRTGGEMGFIRFTTRHKVGIGIIAVAIIIYMVSRK